MDKFDNYSKVSKINDLLSGVYNMDENYEDQYKSKWIVVTTDLETSAVGAKAAL